MNGIGIRCRPVLFFSVGGRANTTWVPELFKLSSSRIIRNQTARGSENCQIGSTWRDDGKKFVCRSKKKKNLSSFFFFSGFLLIMNGKFSETAGGIGCRLILCVAAKCLDSRPLLLLSTIRAIGIIKPAPFSLSSDEGSIHTHTPHTRRKERNLAGAGDTMSGLHLQTSDLLIFYFFFFSFTRKKERFRLSRINNVLARQ